MLPVDRAVLERALSALDAAWQDLHDWKKFATDHRLDATQAGLAQTEAVILKVAYASTELRNILELPDAP